MTSESFLKCLKSQIRSKKIVHVGIFLFFFFASLEILLIMIRG